MALAENCSLKMLYSIIKNLSALLCKLLFRIKVSGRENIPAEGGFILASNHLSLLDPVVLAVSCPRKLNFIARHDLFRNPLFSGLISNVGAFAVKRGSPDISALKEGIKRVVSGGGLLIFPEGGRQRDTPNPKPHKGIGFIAAKTGAWVIPAFISGTDKALPVGAKFIRLAKISVHFGKRISTEAALPYEEIADKIMNDIRRIKLNER